MAHPSGRKWQFKIPTELRVRDQTWRVHLAGEVKIDPGASRVAHRKLRRDMLTARGLCYPNEHEIVIGDQSEREARVVLIHELLHACSRDKIPRDQEEKFVRDVERALLAALERLDWGPV